MELSNRQALPYVPRPANFRMMIAGQVISIFGSALIRFTLSLYVLNITGRADVFATLFAISNIPLLFAPVGGAIADRYNRRNLMVVFDLTSSFVILVCFLILLAGNTSVVLIGGVMILLSVISAMYTPAVTACVPLLVKQEKLESANGLVQAVQSLSNVAAPILGGVLFGYMGMKLLVVCSCAAFALSALMEMFIRIPFVKREQTAGMVKTILGDLKAGFVYVIGQPFIRKSMLIAAALNLLLTPYLLVGGPIILRITMGVGDVAYGIGMGVINAAAIVGALAIGFFAKTMKMRTLYRWLLLIAAVMLPMAVAVTPLMLGAGNNTAFLVFILCGALIAMALTVVSIFVITKIQKHTPDENLGKVMAILTAAAQSAAPVGQVLYGIVFEAFSTRIYLPTVLASAAVVLVAWGTRRVLREMAS